MGWPQRLVLVRHGESEGNVLTAEERTRLDISTHDYALTARGRRQAELTGEYLRVRYPDGFQSVFSSYYRRARETAELLDLGVPVRENALLAEANRGIWHSMTREEVMKRFPEEVARHKRDGLYHYCPLGGESQPDIEQRINVFLIKLQLECEDETVCVVGHGHLFVSFQRVIDGITIAQALERRGGEHFANASVTVYKPDPSGGRPRLKLVEENRIPWAGKI